MQVVEKATWQRHYAILKLKMEGMHREFMQWMIISWLKLKRWECTSLVMAITDCHVNSYFFCHQWLVQMHKIIFDWLFFVEYDWWWMTLLNNFTLFCRRLKTMNCLNPLVHIEARNRSLRKWSSIVMSPKWRRWCHLFLFVSLLWFFPLENYFVLLSNG